MTFWRQNRRTSWIAKAMLGVWLSALVISWANACLLPETAAGGSRVHDLAEHAQLARSGAGVHGHAIAGHREAANHDIDGARLACQAVCDDGQHTLPKVGTPSMPDLGSAPMLPVALWSFLPDGAQPSGVLPPSATTSPPEPPVAIRFLRLTI